MLQTALLALCTAAKSSCKPCVPNSASPSLQASCLASVQTCQRNPVQLTNWRLCLSLCSSVSSLCYSVVLPPVALMQGVEAARKVDPVPSWRINHSAAACELYALDVS